MPSTATEWLEQNAGAAAALDEVLLEAGVPMDVITEYPPWMKREIAQQLKDTFAEPYWDDIARTFKGDAERYLRAGLRDGHSIRKMAKAMADTLGGGQYAKNRATNIARTESGNALNGARKAGMNRLMEDVQSELDPDMGGVMRPTWLSVLGDTTRATHADLDGVPADEYGNWNLAGYTIPWPAHRSLPPEERCNCQCTVVMELGMRDQEARQLIDEHYGRQEQTAAGEGTTLQQRVDSITNRLESVFKGPGRAAAINEIRTAAQYPEYLKAILTESPGVGEIEAVVNWSIRRGRIWEAS